MTFDQFCALQEDILQAFADHELTESQLEREMEQLQDEWDEFGEE